MRQAIVIIHGIGEQRPMSTLRNFVTAVAPDGRKPKFWSKPDRMSDLLELRRLTIASTGKVPVTDFFEYYWAHRVRDTKLAHVVKWFIGLLFTLPGNVPPRLIFLWWVTWFFIALSIGLLGTGVNVTFDSWVNYGIYTSSLISLVFAVASGFVLKYMGDAARYLTPSPENISIRQQIRTDGIRLLRRLHKSPRGYERIILVGHSLGSVIAYDIIRSLWNENNDQHSETPSPQQPALNKIEKTGPALKKSFDKGQYKQGARKEFRDNQFELLNEQQKLGFPWLITDLITLGSPLAHAQMLLAKNKLELEERQEERELPTCPPVEDKDRGHLWPYSYEKQYIVKKVKHNIRIIHHGAPFACTQWTNMYFQLDLIGGDLSKAFGPGIENVLIEPKKLNFKRLFPHTLYWEDKAAIDQLRKALDFQ